MIHYVVVVVPITKAHKGRFSMNCATLAPLGAECL